MYVSEVVIREIEQTPDANQKECLLNVIAEYDLRVLPLTDEANNLAHLYLAERILPEKKLDYARHIALTTVNQIGILLSWNFKHLANINKQLAVKVINERAGYFYPMLLTNHMEVLYEIEMLRHVFKATQQVTLQRHVKQVFLWGLIGCKLW